MSITFQNIQGHPSSKFYKHKWKYVKEQSEQTDIRVILETGCNRNNDIITGSDEMVLTRENKMKVVDKEQY